MNRALRVPTLILLVLGFATTAFASSLAGSVHDLYSGTRKQGQGAGDDDDSRICMYCHMPHSPRNKQDARWGLAGSNKSFAALDEGAAQGAPKVSLDQSTAICLTCHDGSVATDSAFRVVRSGSGTGQSRGGGNPTTDSVPDLDLALDSSQGSMSHPVGIQYLLSPDLVAPPAEGKFANGVRIIEGKVECASCHNPHSATSPPFLAAPNDGSSLCYTCHVK